jgi:hypothetical protein
MNRRQEERVADLGRAFQEALRDIIDMGEEVSVEPYPENYNPRYDEAPPIEMPVEISHPLLASYEINIRQVHNGFIVNAGCQRFVFEKFETASKYIEMYFKDPNGTEKKHCEGTLFK